MSSTRTNLCNFWDNFSKVQPVILLEEIFQCSHLNICCVFIKTNLLSSWPAFVSLYQYLEWVKFCAILASHRCFLFSQHLLIGILNSNFGKLLLLLLVVGQMQSLLESSIEHFETDTRAHSNMIMNWCLYIIWKRDYGKWKCKMRSFKINRFGKRESYSQLLNQS